MSSLVPKVKEVLPDLDESDLKNVSAIYGICITDEALANYHVLAFAEDIKYLLSLANEIIEEPEIPVPEEDPKLEPETATEVQLSSIRQSDEQTNSWAIRTQKAMDKENQLMKVLASYYQANSMIETALINFNNDLVLHNINQRMEIAIKSILIREHLLPLYQNIHQLYLEPGVNSDLRFITAQIIFFVRNLIEPQKTPESQASIFEELKKGYPLGHGDDLYWDLAERMIYYPYYEGLKNMLIDQIDKGIKEKQQSIESMRASLSAKAPEQGTDESLRSKVDSLIFETMQFGRHFDGQRKEKLRQLLESLLKRKALQEYGVQDISDLSKYSDWFMDEFFPILKEYPQMLLPFIDIRFYRAFSEDPLGHFESQKAYMMNQFWFKMRKNGYKTRDNSTPYEISTAFAEIVYEVLNDPKVMSFEV